MPRPKTKAELINAAELNYSKLCDMIDNLSEKELNTPYDFSHDEKKKEVHWGRDKNIRDVIMHLCEWQSLMLDWIKNRETGENKPFLMEGYTWKTYGDMNMVFFERCQNVPYDEARKLLSDSHNKIMKAIDTFSEEELFVKSFYPWVGGSNIGSYFISVTSSHYDWAMKKIKAHKKNIG